MNKRVKVFVKECYPDETAYNNIIRRLVSRNLITKVNLRRTGASNTLPFNVMVARHSSGVLIGYGSDKMTVVIYTDADFGSIGAVDSLIEEFNFVERPERDEIEGIDLGWFIKELNMRALFFRGPKLAECGDNTQGVIKNKLILSRHHPGNDPIFYKDVLDAVCTELFEEKDESGGYNFPGSFTNSEVFNDISLGAYDILEIEEARAFVQNVHEIIEKDGIFSFLQNNFTHLEDLSMIRINRSDKIAK